MYAHLNLRQPRFQPPAPEFLWSGDDPRPAVGAMCHRDGTAGLHPRASIAQTLEAKGCASLFFASIGNFKAAGTLAFDDDVAVLRAQFNLANVSAHRTVFFRGENYPRR